MGSTPDTTLPEALAAAARRHSGITANIDGERTFAFADVDAASHHLATVLLGLGLVRGDRIALLAPSQINGCRFISPPPRSASRWWR